jgi:phosphoglucomutase
MQLIIPYSDAGSNAVQIIPPHDHGIAASIDASLEVDEDAWIVDDAINNWQGTQEMISDYYEMSRSLSLHTQ